MKIIVFYLLCIVGWQCFEKLKIPTPAILGPMFALCTANLLGLSMAAPPCLKPALSIIMGTMMGLRFNLKLKGMYREIVLVSSWIILLSYLTAQVLVYLGLPKATAMFSAMPGGLAELTLAAMSYGADIFVVALLQSSRLLTTMVLIPIIVKRLPEGEVKTEEEKEHHSVSKETWGVIILLGIASAYITGLLDIPASNLIGPIIAVGIYTRIYGVNLKINQTFQQYVQIGVGGLIGMNATRESILGIPEYLIQIICLNILIIGGGIILGCLLHKMTGWDLTTCLLATSPAGLTPMIVLSMELNADSSRVVVFQLLRLTTVVLFAPLGGHLVLTG